MDIHRCRFVPYPSSAINALAFSHPSSTNPQTKAPPTLRLAIGRANGDIEIWNPLKGSWFQESILRGGKDRSIEGLAWTQDPPDVDKRGYKVPGKLRLFSIGYSQTVTEWDLASGMPLRHSPGNNGEVWCLAAQPKGEPPQKNAAMSDEEQAFLEAQAQTQNIAVGCADGSIVIHSTAEEDLRFDRVLARPAKKKTRVLSLTFQNRHTIIAGHADSTIRIYDMRGGQPIRSMTLGGGSRGGPKETLVWSVMALNNGTIVSGDSTGTVSFWDGKQYALTQRIKGHEADVLDLVVSADGRSVFSGGMDRRTVQYRLSGGSRSGDNARWSKISHSRVHENDVKAMAAYEAKAFSILASGGLDTNPILVPIQESGKEHHRTLSSLPHQPTIASSPSTRLMASWWDRQLSIWSFPESREQLRMQDTLSYPSQTDGRRLMLKMFLEGQGSISSADIATNGDLLSLSTMVETKLFSIRPRNGMIKARKLLMPSQFSNFGAKFVKFSPDCHWLLVVKPNDHLQLIRIVGGQGSKPKPRVLPKSANLVRLLRKSVSENYSYGTLGDYNRSISRATFSSDSRILAMGDQSGYLDTWVLEGYEDVTQGFEEAKSDDVSNTSEDSDFDEEDHPQVIFGQQWIRNPAADSIPNLRHAPLILSFRPIATRENLTITNGNTAVHPTRHNPYPHSHDLPAGEDRLLVVTADNNIREFSVLTGRLTDWSRRNPHQSFPDQYRGLKDRAKGVVWDVSRNSERIWIYGVSWLWMFDLSQDLPLPEAQQEETTGQQATARVNANGYRKRKRQAEDRSDGDDNLRLRRDTGAGSKIPDRERGTGVGSKLEKINGPSQSNMKVITLDNEPELGSDDEDDLDPANQTALLSLRRGDAADEDALHVTHDQDEEIVDGDDQMLARRRNPRPPYWHTYKYRPILGIVPLGGDRCGDNEAGEGGSEDADGEDLPLGVEVALVERPLWEMDLPARYVGDQEWAS